MGRGQLLAHIAHAEPFRMMLVSPEMLARDCGQTEAPLVAAPVCAGHGMLSLAKNRLSGRNEIVSVSDTWRMSTVVP